VHCGLSPRASHSLAPNLPAWTDCFEKTARRNRAEPSD